MARPPVGFSGLASSLTTCWPGVSTAAAATCAIVRPSTGRAEPLIRPPAARRCATSARPPASRALASRCKTPFVDPPVAATEAIAFSRAARVTIWRGRTSLAISSMTSRPACSATSSLCGSSAGTSFAPGGLIPRNSIAVDIVFAVNWPPHAPAPGQALSSISRSSAAPILPAATAPTASKTSISVMSRPRWRPAAIVPLYRASPGMLMRTSAITAAGIVLSQPTIKTRPSKRCPRATSSIESAITSRLTSEAFMPSVPIETPSETAMVLNSIGVPPAARMPAFTFSARRRWLKLHGIVSIQLCPTPMMGLAKSSRVNPMARSMERAPARLSPSVNRALSRFSGEAPFGFGMDSPSSKSRFYRPNRYDATTRSEDSSTQMSASTTEAILPEAGLRAEIRLLGQLLGETLREHEGLALYELEESIRLRTKELRQRYDATEEVALVAELGRIPLGDAARLVRAFATYFQLVNLAELERQARAVAETTEDAGELDRSVARFAAQHIPANRLTATLEQLEVRPVLTAHPTEAVRRSILDHQDRIGQELAQLRAPLSTRERDRVRQRIATQVEVLWHTDEVRSVRPRVLDEVGKALFYLERTFFDAIPEVHEQLVEALTAHYPG